MVVVGGGGLIQRALTVGTSMETETEQNFLPLKDRLLLFRAI